MGVVWNYIKYINRSIGAIWTKTDLVWWDYWLKIRWNVVIRIFWYAWMRVCWHDWIRIIRMIFM